MAPKTVDRLKAVALALIENETERDPVPAAILRMCEARSGKPITKKDASALEAEFPGLCVTISRDGNSGTRIRYWTPVSKGGYDGNKRLPDDHVSASGYTGTRDANGEAIYSKALAAKQIALYRLGVPDSQSAYGVEVRQWNWADPQRGRGVTRWPSVAELREWNRSCYGARDERNTEREHARETLDRPDAVPLDKIATLVDEVNLMIGELRAYVDDDATPRELARAVSDLLTVTLEKKATR